MGSRDSSVGTATDYGLEGRGSIPIRGKRFFSTPASRPALGPTQPPSHWVLGALSPGVKRLGRESNHYSPCNAKVKNGGAIPPLPHTYSWCGAYLSTGTALPLSPEIQDFCLESFSTLWVLDVASQGSLKRVSGATSGVQLSEARRGLLHFGLVCPVC
jgi:hypothetical protein